MDENEITQRLRETGNRPVPGEVRSTHLTQMHAAVPTVERPKRFGRVAVAAAAIVGFTVGSTGFAMAGALPDPAQGVAHDVLSVVQVDVPDRPDNHGKCISTAAKIADPAEKQAQKDLCKESHPPGRSGQGNGQGRPDHAGVPGGPNGVPHAEDPCKGPPPWAGKGAKDVSAEEKQAFRTGCVDDDGDDPADAQADALEEQQEREAEQRDAAADAAEEQRELEEERLEAEADALEEQQPEAEGSETQGPPDSVPTPPAPADPPADAPAPLEQGTDPEAD